MDLTEPGPRPEMSEQSGEYRLRFRYQLWSQAAQDFRSRPAAPQRFVSTGRNSAAPLSVARPLAALEEQGDRAREIVGRNLDPGVERQR